ncbi:NACHT domain-containing protein [Mycena venus]|uniref:NACHT domain-containing protein n=1 Tax=Mycena venus TaxID=2733690 RepID=A0A8H6Z3E7_9AGAR|nr:NACHT domain-containing protein [Mycena venus]
MPPLAFFSGYGKNGKNEQKTRFKVTNHIYGGVGGHGGGGGAQGQGGAGGAGEGPTLNYYIEAEEGNVKHIHRHGEPVPSPTTVFFGYMALLVLESPPLRSPFASSWRRKVASGASFFFKRKHSSRGNAKRLFPTLAYQLALVNSRLKHAISPKIEENPSILDRSLSTQLRKLILEPCRQSSYRRTLVIVVDGLDECDGHNIQQEILRSIGTALDEGPLPLRFFVTSRLEPHICEMFTGVLKGIHRPVNIEQSFEAVQKYLVDEFARIHRDHRRTMSTVTLPWPSQKIIADLVKKSSGYFIYASTVIKFIDDKNFRPTERLQVIVGTKKPDSESPFAALDELYTQILSMVPNRPRLLKILTIIGWKVDLPFGYTDHLLDLDPGDVHLALRGLQSVIRLKKPEPDREDPDIDPKTYPEILVHHASFYDFLQDRTRAGKFYVGDGPHLTDVCCHILKALSYMYEDSSWNTSRRIHVSK